MFIFSLYVNENFLNKKQVFEELPTEKLRFYDDFLQPAEDISAGMDAVSEQKTKTKRLDKRDETLTYFIETSLQV